MGSSKLFGYMDNNRLTVGERAQSLAKLLGLGRFCLVVLRRTYGDRIKLR